MLEDSRTKKRRGHPDGSQRRNFLEKSKWLGRHQDRRRVGQIILTRRDQSNRALVVSRPRVGMKPRVQLRRSRQAKREKKRREQTARNKSAEFFATAFMTKATLQLPSPYRKQFRREKGESREHRLDRRDSGGVVRIKGKPRYAAEHFRPIPGFRLACACAAS